MKQITWPEGKKFAFTVFDDPDAQTVEDGEKVYSFLADLGFRTTKAVWPIRGNGIPSDNGGTCAEEDYLRWVLDLKQRGFEIAYHNATSHTSDRAETIRGLEQFEQLFGSNPRSMAFHYNCDENMYWGDHRVSGYRRAVYNALTLGKNKNRSFGHVDGHEQFWGDQCRERITYVRNFGFSNINTLAACPLMPYHDPARPLVNLWFGCSEGSDAKSFKRVLQTQKRKLIDEAGCCIMYTHFGHGYVQNGKLDPVFCELMTDLSKEAGWFVPVSTILDFLTEQRGTTTLTDRQRSRLETRWLWEKVRVGSN